MLTPAFRQKVILQSVTAWQVSINPSMLINQSICNWLVNKLNILLIITFNAKPTFAIEINIPEGNKKSTNIKQKF
jgi:hypothetical protein